jgi:hypothetical protein
VKIFISAVVLLIFFPVLAQAQQVSGNQESDCMPGMPMPGCPDSTAQQSAGMQMGNTGLMSMQGMQPQTFLQAIVHHASSGTSEEPNSTPTPMLMTQKGAWMLMFHANVFVLDEQQSSSRGGDKLFSTNWFMPMAQRELGLGVLTVRTMLSLEPATVTDRRYPLLFEQGETAFGVPIADGQHPHDFIMELARKCCCRSILLQWATLQSDRQRIRIALQLLKIQLERSDITKRIPRTSPTMWSHLA